MKQAYCLIVTMLLVGELASARPGTLRTRGSPRAQRAVSPMTNLLVTVTGKKGAPVTGIKESDLRVFEDGKAQTVTRVVDVSTAPLSIVLLVDRSGSAGDSTPKVKSALDAVIRLFKPSFRSGQDKVALVAFDSFVSIEQSFTDALAQLVPPVNRSFNGSFNKTYGGTALYDAVAAASALLSKEPGRRLIFLISDGEDTVSRTSREDAWRMVHDSHIAVFSIFIGNRPWAVEGRDILEGLTAETGGRFFNSGDFKEFDKIRDDLNSQYSIAYASSNPKLDGKFRKVRVEAINKNYRVRHPSGYYAPR